MEREMKTPVVLFDEAQRDKGGKTAREYYEEMFVTKVAQAIEESPPEVREAPSKP